MNVAHEPASAEAIESAPPMRITRVRFKPDAADLVVLSLLVLAGVVFTVRATAVAREPDETRQDSAVHAVDATLTSAIDAATSVVSNEQALAGLFGPKTELAGLTAEAIESRLGPPTTKVQASPHSVVWSYLIVRDGQEVQAALEFELECGAVAAFRVLKSAPPGADGAGLSQLRN